MKKPQEELNPAELRQERVKFIKENTAIFMEEGSTEDDAANKAHELWDHKQDAEKANRIKYDEWVLVNQEKEEEKQALLAEKKEKEEEARYAVLADNFHPGFLRQRRNLLLSCLALLFLKTALPIENIKFLDNKLAFTDTTTFITGVWLITAYFYFRFLSYFWEFQFKPAMKKHKLISFLPAVVVSILPFNRRFTDYLIPLLLGPIMLGAVSAKISMEKFLQLVLL